MRGQESTTAGTTCGAMVRDRDGRTHAGARDGFRSCSRSATQVHPDGRTAVCSQHLAKARARTLYRVVREADGHEYTATFDPAKAVEVARGVCGAPVRITTAPRREDLTVTVYRDEDPLGSGQWYGYARHDGSIIGNFGPFASPEAARERIAAKYAESHALVFEEA